MRKGGLIVHALKTFLLTLPAFLAIDFIWLGLVARPFYDRQLAGFARTLRWPAAIGVYLLLVLGVVLLAVPRAEGSLGRAALYGAILGLVAYGTYDLTNHALFEHFSLTMTIVDLIWGMTVMGTTAVIATWISNRIS